MHRNQSSPPSSGRCCRILASLMISRRSDTYGCMMASDACKVGHPHPPTGALVEEMLRDGSSPSTACAADAGSRHACSIRLQRAAVRMCRGQVSGGQAEAEWGNARRESTKVCREGVRVAADAGRRVASRRMDTGKQYGAARCWLDIIDLRGRRVDTATQDRL